MKLSWVFFGDMPSLQKYFMTASNFNFVHFLSLKHSTPAEISSFEILFFIPKMLDKIALSTDWGFVSIY